MLRAEQYRVFRSYPCLNGMERILAEGKLAFLVLWRVGTALVTSKGGIHHDNFALEGVTEKVHRVYKYINER